jgi:hypothetical protein
MIIILAYYAIISLIRREYTSYNPTFAISRNSGLPHQNFAELIRVW